MSASSIAAAGALSATSAAAFVIPAAWPLVAEMFEDQCDPEAVLQAGLQWIEMAGDLGNADSTAKDLIHALPPEHWTGEDRQAFEAKMNEYSWQITFEQAYAYVVGAAMICLAVMLFLLIAAMVIIAAIMAWHAVVVGAAMVGLITAPAAVAEANAVAVQCFNTLDKIDNVEEAVARGLAGAIAAMMAVEVGAEMWNGNSAALGDLGGSLVDASDNIMWGTLSRLERDFNKSLMNGGKWPSNRLGFQTPQPARTAGTWGNATTWGSATGTTPGNITDTVHAQVPDFNG
ncbi:MAG TPA: hypothetical protein VFU43_11030 [Streptosporangiaceae bacterium]|nr:hypothetical protein [Streptosporangiaceae bacterium]